MHFSVHEGTAFEDINGHKHIKTPTKKDQITKQVKFLLLALVVALMGFSLASCGDDNDEPSGGSIVGTWEGNYLHGFESTNGQDGIFESSKGYIKFNDDNTYISVSDIIYTDEWVQIFGGDKYEIEIEHGSYEISGNIITITKLADPEVPSLSLPFPFSVKGNKLTLVALGESFTFTRVSDSRINKYLN